MRARDLKWFDSLQRRDMDNGAVISEIREVFKQRDALRTSLGALVKVVEDGDWTTVELDAARAALKRAGWE